MELQGIKELYLNGESLSELSRKYNVSTSAIKKELLKENVEIRSRVEQNFLSNKKRKRKVDENYFSNIDSVNKAWMLGFLAAKGSIKKDRNEIKIILSSVDTEILEKIKNELKIESDIVTDLTNQGYYVSTLSWTSEQHKKDLATFGIVHGVTYLPLHLPKILSNKNKLAFILGYFDGNGAITSNKKIRILSYRKEILEDFALFLKKKYSITRTKKGLFELTVTDIQILRDMYSLNSIRLDRKYQKYLEYINQETMTS